MTILSWPAPAKLNLFLHVVARRADGYHALQTVFQLLDYYDELTFDIRTDKKIHLESNNNDIPPANNLVTRAALLLQQKSGTSLGANIYLHKQIPIGGGLGGGSSNAATTLVALNQLWKLHLSTTELSNLALQLGADIPIFVLGKTAWAEGVGEKLKPIPLNESWFIILKPPCLIATAEIFSATELTRNTPPITIQEFLNGDKQTRNDCEPVVRKRYPIIAQALDWLNRFVPARLTGTGGCVFGALENKEQAQHIAQQVPSPFQGFVAKGLNHSPLLQFIKNGVSPSGKARGFDPRIPRFES